MKGFEKVEIYINTRGTGGEGRRHYKQIIKEKHVNTSMRDGFFIKSKCYELEYVTLGDSKG